MRTVWLHPVGHLVALDVAQRVPRLQHELRHEALEVGQERAGRPGSRARSRRGGARPCQARRLNDAITRASSGVTPRATASRTIELMCPSATMCSGSRSSVQNAMRCGPNSVASGSSAWRLRARRGLADQHPHAGAQALAALLDRAAPRGRSGCRPRRRRSDALPSTPGRVAVDVRRALEQRELLRARARHRRRRRGSSSSRRARAPAGGAGARARSPVESGRRGDSKLRRRHGRRGHEEDVERERAATRRAASGRRRCRARSRSRAGRRPRSSSRAAARAARTRPRGASTTRGACARRRSPARRSGRRRRASPRPRSRRGRR